MECREELLANWRTQAIGAAPDAVRMQRVVNFYEKLPRGAAPEVKATGILGRYQAKHFGKNPSAKRMWPSPRLRRRLGESGTNPL